MNLLHIKYLACAIAINNCHTHCRPMEKQDVTKPTGNPCVSLGQGDPADFQDGSREELDLFSFDTVTPPPNEYIDGLITLCAESEGKARELEQALLEKIGSEEVVKAWEEEHVHGFSFLLENITEVEKNGNSTDYPKKPVTGMEMDLETDFAHVNISRIYLEQIRKDDEEKSDFKLTKEISDLSLKLDGLWCHLKSMGEFEDHVSDDVMPENERNIDDIAKRLKRDYIFVRDLGVILKSKKEHYLNKKIKPCS